MPELAAGSLAGKLSSNVLSWVRSERVLLDMAIPFPPAPVPVITLNAPGKQTVAGAATSRLDRSGIGSSGAPERSTVCFVVDVASWQPSLRYAGQRETFVVASSLRPAYAGSKPRPLLQRIMLLSKCELAQPFKYLIEVDQRQNKSIGHQ